AGRGRFGCGHRGGVCVFIATFAGSTQPECRHPARTGVKGRESRQPRRASRSRFRLRCSDSFCHCARLHLWFPSGCCSVCPARRGERRHRMEDDTGEKCCKSSGCRRRSGRRLVQLEFVGGTLFTSTCLPRYSASGRDRNRPRVPPAHRSTRRTMKSSLATCAVLIFGCVLLTIPAELAVADHQSDQPVVASEQTNSVLPHTATAADTAA